MIWRFYQISSLVLGINYCLWWYQLLQYYIHIFIKKIYSSYCSNTFANCKSFFYGNEHPPDGGQKDKADCVIRHHQLLIGYKYNYDSVNHNWTQLHNNGIVLIDSTRFQWVPVLTEFNLTFAKAKHKWFISFYWVRQRKWSAKSFFNVGTPTI